MNRESEKVGKSVGLKEKEKWGGEWLKVYKKKGQVMEEGI